MWRRRNTVKRRRTIRSPGNRDRTIEIVALLRGGTAKPIWAKPNAGLPELVNGETVFRQTPEETVAYFPLLVEAGAHIVGGCCGTTPTHIAKLDEARDNLVCSSIEFLEGVRKLNA